MKVLNFGSLNYDYVYLVDHIVQAGETLSSTGMNTFCGGKGLNQSVALVKAGVPVYLAGTVGDEAKFLLEECKKNGVNTEYVQEIEGESGHAIIQVDKTGKNCILLFGGANRKQTKEHMDKVLTHFEKGDMILLQNEINDLDYLIDRAYEKGMVIALNPSPFDKGLDTCDFTKVSLFFINEIEGEQMTGKKKADDILNELKQVYPDAKVVLTLGSDGCIYQEGKIRIRQPIFKVDVVDTTAAGDTFTGYFISSIFEKLPIEEGLKIAAKASAIAVSRKGATASIPNKEEVFI